MSVWPSFETTGPVLSSTDGELLCVSVAVQPRFLEELLDALARLTYPINPQIYHDGATIYRFSDGHEESEPTTIVEFPAYEGWIPEIRRTLEAYGFNPDSLHITSMLEEIRSDEQVERAPRGADYESRVRVKHAHPLTQAAH